MSEKRPPELSAEERKRRRGPNPVDLLGGSEIEIDVTLPAQPRRNKRKVKGTYATESRKMIKWTYAIYRNTDWDWYILRKSEKDSFFEDIARAETLTLAEEIVKGLSPPEGIQT